MVSAGIIPHAGTFAVTERLADLFTRRITVVGGEPAGTELSHGGDVHDAVVQVREQARHVAPQELHVHVHRVAGQPRLARLCVIRHEGQQLRAHAFITNSSVQLLAYSRLSRATCPCHSYTNGWKCTTALSV